MKGVLPLYEMAETFELVSVSKPYMRLIVRVKEAKNGEFGAKCNIILVDGYRSLRSFRS